MSKSIKIAPSGSLKLLAHLGAIVTISCWGASFVSTKVLMEQGGFSPVEMFVYRFACAYVLMLLLTCNKRLHCRKLCVAAHYGLQCLAARFYFPYIHHPAYGCLL